MQELVDMLRAMTAACLSVAKQHPVGVLQATQYAMRGSMPGIRAGLAPNLMVRITIEQSNNVDNAEASMWNTMWVDPTHGE